MHAEGRVLVTSAASPVVARAVAELADGMRADATAPELLPGFWRVVGQLLPPGAGGQALRDVAHSDGQALLAPALVLAAWAVLGAALIIAGRRRTPMAAPPAPLDPRVAVPA